MIAKKSFGQHFLHDQSVIKKIITAAEITPGEIVLEVGPGHGVLTQALVEAGAKVIAVEADRDLIPELEATFAGRAQIVFSDVLKIQISDLFRHSTFPAHRSLGAGGNIRNYKLVANLPYNIASAVMEKFLSAPHPPKLMVVMVQKEVAERMLAKPGEMSVLSVACQIYAEVKRVTNVSPGAFSPPPKVDSTVVKLDRTTRTDTTYTPEVIIALAKRGFRSRRKLLRSNLEGGKWSKEAVREAMTAAHVDEMARAQELSVEQWISLWYNLS